MGKNNVNKIEKQEETKASPKLHSFVEKNGKENFRRSQHFGFCNGVAMLVGPETPGCVDFPRHRQKFKYSPFLHGETSEAPAWLAFHKQVLCFDAYFQEAISQSIYENLRVRKCKIYYYLEDDTIQVVEPESKNSGIIHGTLIRRHRIPLPPPKNDSFYNVHHFNINQEVVFYSRTFVITNCDPFTRNFLTKLGVRINPLPSTPPDAYNSRRQEMLKAMKPLRPYEKVDTRKQFLEHDRRVLRFFCHWKDSENLTDLRKLVLHYFLADDTIEIYETVSPNSGRDAVPKFLQRDKLPKTGTSLPQPGIRTSRTILNVLGSVGGEHYILDNLKTGALQKDFYKDCDLTIGAEINVLGRKVVICDCDDFTKEYYRTKYGIEDFTPISVKIPPLAEVTRPVPPYTGFGSEEDSLCSCQKLLLKPPPKDFWKYMEKDRQGLVSNVLRFSGQLLTDSLINKQRHFVISFFLSDDTISVFEPHQKNAGIVGGKFLERVRVKKPGQKVFKSEMSEYFTAQDLFVGETLNLNNHPFKLVNADEFTLSYMEQHAEQFPKANVGTVLSKIKSIREETQKDLKQFFSMSDPSNTGLIPYESFRTLLSDTGVQLCEHEIITLARAYLNREQTKVDLDRMLAVAQSILKKRHFESFSEMSRAFTHKDRQRTGHLSAKEAWIICKGFRLPLSDDTLRPILDKFQDESEKIDYHAFLSALNYRVNPTPVVLFEGPKKVDPKPAVKTINYSLFLEDAFGPPANHS